jgi:ferredoxin-NADP reductase
MHTITFIKKQEVAENTFLYTFTRPEGYTFQAGQYIALRFNDEEVLYEDEKANTRSFSFASAPYEEDLGFMMRQSESGFKKNIHSLKEGDEAMITDPLGKCFYGGMEGFSTLVMISAGVGITPMRSILRQAVYDEIYKRIILINSNRMPESTPELDWFERIGEEKENISIVNTMTDIKRSKKSWQGYTRYIDAEMIREQVTDTNNTRYFIAGGAGFIKAMGVHLKTLSIPEDRVCFDNFG